MRRWRLLLGPGVLTAFLIVAMLARSGRLPGGPATIAKAPAQHLPASPVGLVPEPGWLVRVADQIPLNPEQLQLAQKLAADWARDSAGDREAAAQASGELSGYLDRQRERGAFGPQQVRAQGQALAEASAALAARRHDCWDQVWATMSAAQRTRVQELRQQAPLEMR